MWTRTLKWNKNKCTSTFKKCLHVPILYLLRDKILYIIVTLISLCLSSQLTHENSKPWVGLQDFISLLTEIKQSSFVIYANTKWELASFYTTKTEVTWLQFLIQFESLEIPMYGWYAWVNIHLSLRSTGSVTVTGIKQ